MKELLNNRFYTNEKELVNEIVDNEWEIDLFDYNELVISNGEVAEIYNLVRANNTIGVYFRKEEEI